MLLPITVTPRNLVGGHPANSLQAQTFVTTLGLMMNLDDTKALLAALHREGVDYVLVGSMAMAVQGLVRATLDEKLDVDGIQVRVATPAMLYRMKKDTVRPRDRADAAWIRQAFGIVED